MVGDLQSALEWGAQNKEAYEHYDACAVLASAVRGRCKIQIRNKPSNGPSQFGTILASNYIKLRIPPTPPLNHTVSVGHAVPWPT